MKYLDNGLMRTLPEAPATTLEERIQRLEDLRAIEECFSHYVNFCDRVDPAGMASCFAENGKLSWGDIYPTVIRGGRQGIFEHLQSMLGSARTQSHYVTNLQVHFVERDRAIAACHLYSWQEFKDATKKDIYSFGRYETELVREADGEWRFSSFKLVMNEQMGGVRTEEHFNRPWPPLPIE